MAVKVIRKFRLLHDVDGPSFADGDVAQWNDAASKMIGVPLAAAAGSFSLGLSNLGNTLGDTGITGSRVILAGGNGITLSQATDIDGATITVSGITQSAQTQGLFDLTLDGNTAGAPQLVSSGTLTLAGGNNITLSQNGNAVTISGPATVPQSAQTGISSIAASDATYTSGQVEFTGSGIITIRSSAGQRVVVDAAQSVQTQNLHNVSLSGNTSGVMAQISSGTMTLAGGANITLSQNGNAVTISGAAGGGGTQTAISGLANSQTTYTSGTVSLSELGAITIRSTTGNQFQFSVNPQSVQPETQTFLGGLAASDTTYTSGTVRITGVGGGVTVSSNTGQRIDISVAAPVAQTNQAGSLFAVGNSTSSSSGTYDARTLSLRGDGIISIAATNSGFRISATQSVQTQNAVDVTLSGNTAGALALVSSGTVTLAGGNNITLSQAGNAITISGANIGGAQTGISGIANSQTTYTSGTVSLSELGAITIRSTTGNQFQLSVAAQTAESQSIGMSNIGNTSGTTGIASGAQVRFLLAGGNNVTLSQSLNGASGTLTISAASQTVQTQNLVDVTLSGNTAGAMALVSSGTLTLAGGNNITLSQAGNAVTISGPTTAAQSAESQSIGMSNIGNTSGTTGIASGAQVRMLFAGGNNITLSQSLNGASGTITISAPTQTVESQSIGMSNIGNTSGTTGIASGAQVRMLFAGGNNVTLSQSLNGASGTLTISAASQTVQTQNLHNVTISGNTSGALAAISSGTMTLAGGNNITLSQAGNAITISGANVGGAQTGISGLANSQTTFTSGTVSLSELGAITIRSTTGNQFQLSVNSQSVQTQGQMSAGVSTGGNTAGATGVSGTRMVLVGEGVLTLSQTTGAAGNTVSIQAPATSVLSAVAPLSTSTNGSTISILGPPSFSAGVSSVGNTSGNTGITGSQLVFAGGNNITLSQSTNASGGTVTISGANIGGAQTGISGIIASDATYTSGTVQFTGSNMVTVKSSAGQRVVIDATQSVQPGVQQFVVSDTTFSSGTVSLSGFGAVTVNTAANIIRISAPVQTAQTGISGLANSQTTYTSGTVSLSELGAITIRSTTGNQFQLSVAAQTAESQTIGMSNLGNTSGTTGIASGAQVRFLFAGGNNITLSQSVNGASGTITISGPNTAAQTNDSGGVYAVGNTYSTSSGSFDVRTLSIRGDGIISVAASNSGWRISASQSVQAETQTFVGGLAASNTTYTSGTITITGVGGGVTVSSNTGQRIDISVAAQSVQTQNLHNVTLSGNTAGAMAQISSGTMTLAGGNNITLSQAGNAVTISGGAGGAFSAGVSTGGNTAGATGVSGSQMVLVGSGVMSLSQTTGANGNTVSILGPAVSAISAVAPLSTSTNGSTISILGPAQFSGGFSTQGNTAGDTGFVTGRLALVGSNNITLSGSTNGGSQTISIIGGAGGGFSGGVSNVGNTVGDTGITGTRLVFAGGQSITLSQSTNASGGTVTISGASTSQSVQSLGMYAVQNTTGQSSSTTMDARTLSVAGDGAVSVGYSGGSLRISAPTQTVQTQNLHNVTISGNTSGALAAISSGTMTLAGGNNITLSQAGNAITISGANVGGAQTGISGIANSQTTYTSGTVSLSELGAITIRSTTGNQFQLSVNAQTGTQFSAGISGGNTSGDTGTVNGRVVLAGGNNITLSGSTNGASMSITISAGTSGVGSDTDVTAIHQVGHALAVGDWVRLSGTSYVKAQADSEANAEVVGVVSAVAGADDFTLTTGGLVTGLSGLTAGAVYYLSDATPGAITDTEPTTIGSISKPVLIARTTTSGYVFNMRGVIVPSGVITAFLGGISNIGNTSGNTGITGSRLVLAGGNNITLSQSTNASGGTVTISAYTQSVQTQNLVDVTLSGNTSGAMALISSGTMTLAGGNNITLSQAGNAVTISGGAGGGFSAGVSNVGNTSGDTGITGSRLVLAGGNAITLSQSTNASGGTVTISAPSQTVESQSIGMSNLGNTSGTTGIASGGQVRFLFAGGNNVTLSQSLNGASGTLTISAASQTVQTQNLVDVTLSGNTAGAMALVSSGTLTLAGGNNITLSQAGTSGGTLRISAPVQTVESQSIGMSNVGNTSGTTGIASGGQVRFIFAGGNNITLSQSLNGASGTITISAPNLGAGAMSVGVSNLGNTAGSTGVTGTRMVLVGTNNITLSQSTDANGGTISISGGAGGGFSAGVSTGGNTAGDTGVSGTRMVLVGSGPISLSQATATAGNTVSIDAPATSSLIGASGISVSTNGSTISVGQINRSEFNPYNESPMVTGQQGNGTLHIQPQWIPNVQHDRILLAMQISNATNSSGQLTVSMYAGVYTKNAATISLVSSISTSTNFTGSGTAGIYNSYGGPRWFSIPWTNTLTEGDYYVGIDVRTDTANPGGAGHVVSQLLASKFTNSAWSGVIGQASNASDQHQLGLGVFTVTTAGIPASIAFTDLRGSGSVVLRAPIFMLRSGTV